MENSELLHYGILGQKWGIRRFQNPDGSLTALGRLRYGTGDEQGSGTGNTPAAAGKSEAAKAAKGARKVSAMSDEELRARINRLNMEEQYANLEARQKERSTGTAKKLLGNAVRNLAEQSLNRVVSKMVSKAFDKKDNFYIDDYKDADVQAMDSETIKKVADWYTKAGQIERQRSAIADEQKKRTGNK